jgi:hypothetical protein
LSRQGVSGSPSTSTPAPALQQLGKSEPARAPVADNRHTRRAATSVKGPQRSRKARTGERHEAWRRRRERADDRHLARLAKRFNDAGCDVTPNGFRVIPKWVWAVCCNIVNDDSGRAARIYLRRARNKVGAGAIRLAALVPQDNGKALYSWADSRARKVAALGVALLALEVPTRRAGPWEGIVRGVPRGALCALLASAWRFERVNGELRRRRPSLSALAGVHRTGADLESGQVGYLKALELAGFCYAQQLPAHAVERFEACWPSGYATNRYWIVTSIPTRPLSDEQKLALMALHRAGLAIGTETLETVRRRPSNRPAADATPGPVRAAPS